MSTVPLTSQQSVAQQQRTATRFRVLRRTPLTIRSVIFILFCAYLLLGPVPRSSDIVAAALACGLLALFLAIVVAAVLQALYVQRRLSLELYPPDEAIIAGQPARSVVTFSPLWLLPGMVLECRLSCSHEGISIPTISLFQGTPTSHRVAIDISAPHRGNWDIHGVRCTVGDLTGFIRLSWTIPLDSSLIVQPPQQPDTLLPLVSSTQRAGDLVTDAVHRLGDPFDIKPYHSSDGIKKIIWKAFAKRGELLSRHAEASMTPEGFVALFVLAQRSDDDVCGKALTYVRALTELQLDLLLSCEGHSGRTPGHNVDTSQELLIDSVWDSMRSSSASVTVDLQALYDACSRTGVAVTLRKIVVFCSGTRMAALGGAELMQTISQWMEERQVEPVFFVTEPSLRLDSNQSTWTRKARGILFEPIPATSLAASADGYQRFLSTCLSKQWEVFV
jgi:hypothetical protein